MKRAHLVITVALALLSACDPKAPEKPAQPPIPTASTHGHADAEVAADAVKATITAAGRTSNYRAEFDAGQLTRIHEVLQDNTQAASEYQFSGARLTQYSQAPAASTEAIAVQLDDHGRVLQAAAGSRSLNADEVAAIRSRADLLRSHALAARAKRMHAH